MAPRRWKAKWRISPPHFTTNDLTLNPTLNLTQHTRKKSEVRKIQIRIQSKIANALRCSLELNRQIDTREQGIAMPEKIARAVEGIVRIGDIEDAVFRAIADKAVLPAAEIVRAHT